MKKQTLAESLRAPLCYAALWFSFAAIPAAAQTTPTSGASPDSPPPDAAPTALQQPGEDEIVVLSPFIVTAEEDQGSYAAKSTLSATRVRTDLKDVASSLHIVTAEFLKDTGATNNQTLLQYTGNTEVGGIGGNYAGINGSAGASLQDNQRAVQQSPSTSTRVRGLDSAANARNLFLTNLPWDGYNVGRVDLQRGPNSILYGVGAPSGVINNSTNVASFKNGGNVEFRYGSYNSKRTTLDLNYVILPDELAARFDILNGQEKFQQEPAFSDDKRFYGALRYEPKFLAKNGMRTSLRANFEDGEIEANRPRYLPPGDLVTPWFTYMNKETFNHINAWWPRRDPVTGAYMPGYGQALDSGSNAPNKNYAIGKISGGIQSGPIAVYQNPNRTIADWAGGATTPGGVDYYLTPKTLGTWGINQNGQLDNGIGGFIYHELVGIRNYGASDGYAANVLRGPYVIGSKDLMLTDETIFDFYGQLLDGPNKGEWQDFDAHNITLEQTFMDGRYGLEIGYDRQKYNEEQTSVLSTSYQAIQIDINQLRPDGTPNPNVGRPFIAARPSFGNRSQFVDRESARATAFGEFRLDEIFGRSAITEFLGKHRLTGLVSKESTFSEGRSWTRYVADDDYASFVTFPGSPGYPADGVQNIDGQARSINFMAYLGPSMASMSSPTGANLSRLTARMVPSSGNVRLFDSHWNRSSDPANTGYLNPAAPWQNPFLWNDPATPLDESMSTQSENPANYVGWRDRPIKVLNADQGARDTMITNADKTDNNLQTRALVWQGFFWDGTIVPTVGYREDEQTKRVVQPPQRVDKSRDIHSPAYTFANGTSETVKGDTTSWGIVVHTPSFIREKLPADMNVSVFYNESSSFEPDSGRWNVLGQPVASPEGDTTDMGFMVSFLNDRYSVKVNWYESNTTNAALDWGDSWKISFYEAWSYLYARQAENRAGVYSASNWTPTAQMDAAVTDYFANEGPDEFYSAFGIDRSAWQSWIQPYPPPGFKITGDRKSKGVELEFTAQPVKNWNITANATKVDAVNSNTDPALTKWVEDRAEVFSGPAGDIRIWWNTGPRIGDMYLNEVLPSFRLLKAREGQSTPELRKYRFNIISNYKFSTGWLDGFNFGGAYRWEDKVGIGYELEPYEGSYRYNVEKPYWGPSMDHLDLWAGYERKLSEKVRWRIQLNVRDVLWDNDLIPISTQPDGTWAGVRIQNEQTWSLTNTFSF